jgi:hypothetical protein
LTDVEFEVPMEYPDGVFSRTGAIKFGNNFFEGNDKSNGDA